MSLPVDPIATDHLLLLQIFHGNTALRAMSRLSDVLISGASLNSHQPRRVRKV